MPSLQQAILNLVSGIDDASMRMEIARTINYLFAVYMEGGNEAEVRKSLEDVARTVVKIKFPELPPEEQKKLVKDLAEMVMDAFRTQTVFRRVARRMGV